MAGLFFKRIQKILQTEKVEFEDKVIAELVKKHFPDFRRIINELQRYSQFGKIDTGILTQIADVSINEVVKYLKEKDFGSIRKWVANNLDNDPARMYRKVYDSLYEEVQPSTVPHLVLATADYSYKSAFVADQEINMLAFMIEVMTQVNWK